MKTLLIALPLAALALGGVAAAKDDPKPPAASKPAQAAAKAAGGAPATAAAKEPADVPAKISGGAATLSPKNCKIEFIGTHVGEKPDPRVGGFKKFSGKAQVDVKSKSLKSVEVEIDTGSLHTPIPMLTNHLNSPDFFDTRENPKAKFVSTKIEPAKNGDELTIVGDLTLLGTTKEITFPARVTLLDGGLVLRSSFTIDRTEFGMDKMQDRVNKEVTLNVAVGQKTASD